MSEQNKLEVVTPEAVEAEVKPYTFRPLGAPDLFLMATIIQKIGLKEFKVAFESDGIKSLIQNFMMEQKDESNGDDQDIISLGAGIAFEIASVLLGNLQYCENEIYKLLSQTSNLTVEEIKKPGNAAMVLEMVLDFIKKEEFRDFIKVASRSFA